MQSSWQNPDDEERLRGRPGWEHLDEPSHVVVSSYDQASETRAAQRVAAGVAAVRRLLTSRNDSYKRRQLVQLAIINGTYRSLSPL